MYLNEVRLLGRLTRAVELRTTPGGHPVAQFSLALNRKWRDEAGQMQEETTFVDIEAWGKRAETLAKYTAKGDPLYVGGRLRLDQWTDKTTNEKRSRLKVVLDDFQFLLKAQPVTAPSPIAPSPSPASSPAAAPASDDVPF